MKTERRARGARRVAAKNLWRKTRRQARNEQGTTFNSVWEMMNDGPAQKRFEAEKISATKLGGQGNRAERRTRSSINRKEASVAYRAAA